MIALLDIPRTVEREWLDELPADDPRAVRSRRDLRRINVLMSNSTLVARKLQAVFGAGPPRRVAEIGAGDGVFTRQVAAKLPDAWHPIEAVLVDQQKLLTAATAGQLAAMGWDAHAVEADVYAWLAQSAAPVFDVIIANLFLHHFDSAALTRLLPLIARRTRVLVACEPRRSRSALLGSHMLGVIGCNDVTRHDAVASVRAGFRDCELSALWPQDGTWTLREHAGGLFSHCFVAVRTGDEDAGRREGRQ